MLVNDYINTTPHAIVVMDENGKQRCEIPVSGTPVRLIKNDAVIKLEPLPLGRGIPVVKQQPFTTIDDPDRLLSTGKYHIVSMVVADFLKAEGYEGPLYVPDTGPESVVRDKKGVILGVKRFLCYE